MNKVLIENCLLFNGISDSLQEGVSLLIEGERIKEISEGRISAEEAHVVDAKGRFVMPGLIDAHFHALAADPDIGRLDKMPRYLLAQHARKNLEGSLMRGFTSVRDAGGADYGLALAVKSRLIEGSRIFYSGKALSQTGGHADFRTVGEEGPPLCFCGQSSNVFGVVADGVTEVRKAARDQLRTGATQVKIMASGGVASPTDPIWNLQYSEEEIRAVVWEAASWRTYVMAHAYTPEAIYRCVEYGVKTVEHVNLIDEETARFCTERGAWAVPTLVTYEALENDGPELGLPQVSLDKLRHVREVGLRSLEILKAAGTQIGFGTDLLGEMHRYQSREFLIRSEVLSPLELLRSATSENARMMNVEGEFGVIAEGAIADIIVVDGNPLEDLGVLQGQGEMIPLIMKDGEIYKNALA